MHRIDWRGVPGKFVFLSLAILLGPLAGLSAQGQGLEPNTWQVCRSTVASLPGTWQGPGCGLTLKAAITPRDPARPFLHVRIPLPVTKSSQAPAVLFARLAGAVEIRRGDKVLFTRGNPRSTAGRRPQSVSPVLVALGAGPGPHYVDVLLRLPHISWRKAPVHNVSYGSHARLQRDMLADGLAELAVGSALLLFGLITLVTSILPGDRDTMLVRYFAFFGASVGAWTITQSYLLDLLWPVSELWRVVEIGTFFSIVFLLSGFFQHAYRPGERWLLRVLKWIGGGFWLVWALVSALHLAEMNLLLLPYQIVLLISILIWLLATIRQSLRGRPMARVILFSSGLMTVFGIRDLLVNMQILPDGAPVVHWGMLFFVGSLGIGAALQIVQNAARRETAEAGAAALAALNHELRTSLTVLVGAAELLESDGKPDPEYLAMIRDSAGRLKVLIDNALDFSRLQADSVDVRVEPVNLSCLMEQVVRLSGVSISERGNTIHWKPAPEVPETVLIDPFIVERILLNLIHNADKFTNHGKIEVSIELLKADRNLLAFRIADTGTGIPRDMLPSIFEPFQTSRASPHRGGTGLGLSICRTLTLKLGGTLSVESQPGRGSVFSFSFPITLEGQRVVKQHPRSGRAGGA